MLTQKDGKKLLKLARSELNNYFNGHEVKKWDISGFKEKLGVFVSLHDSEHNLRGCIGFPIAHMPLWQSVREAAKAAAFEDPRFLPLSKEELEETIIEISVLTKPELIKEKNPEDIIRAVTIGKDGLIVEYSGYSGLLLPQVATEQKWSAEKLLEQTCIKAGVSPKSWKNTSCKIYKFQAQVFSE
jgi:hypothetical protein